MSESPQKLSIAGQMHSFVRTKAADNQHNIPKALPCHVSAIKGNNNQGDFYELMFDVTNTVFTLPKIIVPAAFSKYTREPTQVGDKGYVVPNDISLSGSDGVDGSTPSMYPRGNLTTGVFHPISTTNWDKRDPDKYYHTGGPKGYRARSADEKSHMEIDPQNTINHISSKDISHSAVGSITHLAQQIISMSATAINHTALGQDITLLTQAGTPPPPSQVTDPTPSGGVATSQFASIGGSGGNINILVQSAQKIINLLASGQGSNITLQSMLGGINLSTMSQLAGINISSLANIALSTLSNIGNISLSSLANVAVSALQGSISISALENVALSAIGLGRDGGSSISITPTGIAMSSGGNSFGISSSGVSSGGAFSAGDLSATTVTATGDITTTGNVIANAFLIGTAAIPSQIVNAPQTVAGSISDTTSAGALKLLLTALSDLGLITDATTA
jgi:hypothetical protein